MAELGRRERRGAGTVVAFGDPDRNRRFAALGENLEDLPAARSELKAIAALYGSAGTVWVGGEATEARVFATPRDATVLHIAAHVKLDDARPLESGVILTPSDADNGFLQAWEVLEGLRCDAEVVTLSGCETGLGREVAGEGIIGLARAFEYAGARSLLVSLWRVEDRATAELMRRFYAHLRGGENAAEALRGAQVELLRGSQRSDGGLLALVGRWWRAWRGTPEPSAFVHPACWAAFRVEGSP